MDDIEIIKEKLISYISIMNKWETENYTELQSKKGDIAHFKQTFVNAKIELDNIYKDYLTQKDRKQTSSHRSLGDPPQYDPDIESIVNCKKISNSRIEIETFKNELSGYKNQYVFLKKNGEWRLDNKKTFWTHKNKWESVPI